MKMIPLPNSKFVNPARVESIDVRSRWFKPEQFYVRIRLRDGKNEDIGSLDRQEALALREKYESMILKSEMDAYSTGREEGHNEGYEKGLSDGQWEGREAGKAEGYTLGHAEGRASARKDCLAEIYSFLDELVTEQLNGDVTKADKRHNLRHSIAAVKKLLARFSSPAPDPREDG